MTGLFMIPRLPQSEDLILPRRPGSGFFSLAIAHREALSAASLSLLWIAVLGLAVVFLLAARRAWPALTSLRPQEKLKRLALCAAGLLALERAAHFAVSSSVDVIQYAWFMPESLDPREPLLTWLSLSLVLALVVGAGGALLGWTAGRPDRRGWVWAAGLLIVAAGAGAADQACYDAGKASLAQAVGLAAAPARTRTFAVLIEKQGVPDYEVHRMDLGIRGQSDFSAESLAAVAAYVASKRSVFMLAGLRFLYAGYAMQMDAESLRESLAEGHRLGDPGARAWLLENLACAPPGARQASYLALLDDESRYRIGPLAAAQLAAAYEHLGDGGKAASWRRRSGIPEGLLAAAAPGGALKPGSISGRIKGAPRPARVGLYAHRDPQAPYALGPGQLIESTTTDASGRFEFKGLAAGSYFLAFYLDFDRGKAPETLRLRGHRGDVRLSKSHPRAELAPLELRL